MRQIVIVNMGYTNKMWLIWLMDVHGLDQASHTLCLGLKYGVGEQCHLDLYWYGVYVYMCVAG